MSFVAAATTVGATVLGTGAAAGIGSTIVGGALIGAGIGGTYSALTGDGNIFDSMLTGATIGGIGGGIGGAFFPGAAGYATPSAAGGIGSIGANSPAASAYANPGISTSKQVADFANASSDPIGALAESGALSGGAGQTATTAAGLTPTQMLGYGLGATTLMGLVGGQQQKGVNVPVDKGDIRPYEYSIASNEPKEGASNYFEPVEYNMYGQTTKPLDTSERNYFTQKFTPLPTFAAADGGQVPRYTQMPAGGLASLQGMRDGYGATQTMDGNIPQFANGGLPEYSFDPETRRYTLLNPPEPEIDMPETRGFRRNFGSILSRIAKPTQEQTPAPQVMFNPELQKYETFAEGGHLGGYSDGGQLLKGPGDGVSDDIPASINDRQPARLADGEFVIPARIVSELGNGSTEAGAKRLYSMMDRIQAGRSKTVGKGKVAVDSKARKHLPA